MWNVCWRCGAYHADKQIDPAGPWAICPQCGHRHPFRQLPLLLVSGASGAGKSAVCQALLGSLTEVVLLDADILWQAEFNTPTDNYRTFFETWLRVCKNISQAGRPVVLFGAGVGVPSNLEQCIERRYFSSLHYLALICDDEELVERLRRRPAWRQTGSDEYQAEHVRFNRWFKMQAAQPASQIETIDTTGATLEESTAQVTAWICGKLVNGKW